MDDRTMLLVAIGEGKGIPEAEVLKMIDELGFEKAHETISPHVKAPNVAMAQKLAETIMATAEVANPINDGDYEKDGLIYCGKCHTPKQCAVEILGALRKPMIPCKCRSEELDKEEREQKERIRSDEIERVRKGGFPDSDMARWTFDNDDGKNPELSKIARRYVERFSEIKNRKRSGLLFFGGVGTGKTYISACIANALIDNGYKCLVANFVRLINTIQGANDKQGYLDGLNEYDLLVIDDLASERSTEYMDETVFNVIDARERNGKPLIITTNLTSRELKDASNIRKARVYSRLFDLCFPYEVKGTDRRRDSLKDDYSEMSEMLGLKDGDGK